MRRLCSLLKRCYTAQEPVLLVGETGGGKTTVCQLLSEGLGLNLRILNCHQYTETSDFLGVSSSSLLLFHSCSVSADGLCQTLLTGVFSYSREIGIDVGLQKNNRRVGQIGCF